MLLNIVSVTKYGMIQEVLVMGIAMISPLTLPEPQLEYKFRIMAAVMLGGVANLGMVNLSEKDVPVYLAYNESDRTAAIMIGQELSEVYVMYPASKIRALMDRFHRIKLHGAAATEENCYTLKATLYIKS